MKTIILKILLVVFILTSVGSYAQTKRTSQNLPQVGIQGVEGKLSIKGLSNGKTTKHNTPVELFKAFKEGVYSINFNFKDTDLKSD